MGAGTAVSIAIPFATYSTEQFYPAGTDSFAPLTWRRFAFRQTILKTWLYERAANKLNPNSPNRRKPRNKVIVRNKSTILNSTKPKPMNLTSKLNYKIDEKINPLFRTNPILNQGSTVIPRALVRNRFKRYDTGVKLWPAESTLPPSGPRLAEVLPIHYSHIFFEADRDYESFLLTRHLRENRPENMIHFRLNIQFISLAPNIWIRHRHCDQIWPKFATLVKF